MSVSTTSLPTAAEVLSDAARPATLGRAHRGFVAVLSMLCASGVLGTLLLFFAQASSEPWLQPTPALLQAVERCRQGPERAGREACVRAVLAKAAAEVNTVRVAQLATGSK